MSAYKPGRPTKYRPSTGEGTEPPHKPGEYRIRDGNGSIQYIGETCDLDRRMNEHIKTGKLAEGYSFEYQKADGRSSSATRREHERQKIEQHSPALNRSGGGEGRIAQRKKRA